MNHIVTAALRYKQAGYSVVGVRSCKKSYKEWQQYQSSFMPDKLLVKTFSQPAVTGIAIVCGEISGRLEVIDLDAHNDLNGRLSEKFIRALQAANAGLLSRLPIALSRHNGYHFFYKCREIGKNTALARRPCTSDEKAKNPQQKCKVLIETRAEGGYIIVAPTPGYRFIQHNLFSVPKITTAERQLLHDIAKSFNEYYFAQPAFVYPAGVNTDPDSPFNDYDRRGNVVELLKKHGWQVVYQTHVKTYFRRPGDTTHRTSGDFNHRLQLFGVFSTSTEFETGRSYRPYAVYAILECQGNFSLAALRLLKEGFGIAYKDRR